MRTNNSTISLILKTFTKEGEEAEEVKFDYLKKYAYLIHILYLQVVSGFQKPCQLFYCQEVKKSCHRVSESDGMLLKKKPF